MKKCTDYTLADYYRLNGSNYIDFYNWIEDLKKEGYYLFQHELQGKPINTVEVYDEYKNNKNNMLNFSSYNYFGLATHPEVIEYAKRAVERYGLSASGSPMLSGSFNIHNEFSKLLAGFMQKEDVVLFPTGYSANVGTISALLRPGDVAIIDKYAHASIIDGAILSRAKIKYFNHNNINHFENCLKRASTSARKLVIVEGVYSVDGDICNLAEIVEIAKRYNCLIMVDEAHSSLIFGENGRGISEHFGVEKEIDISLGTLSKSLGGVGGYITGKKELMCYIQHYARSRFFSCSIPPSIIAGVFKALEIYINDASLRNTLWKNIKYMKELLIANNIDIGLTQSQIIPVMINKDEIVWELGREIINEELFIQPVLYPAVKVNKSRFRLSITANHTKEDMDKAVNIIVKYLKKYKIIKEGK